jgi:hypothetical protein
MLCRGGAANGVLAPTMEDAAFLRYLEIVLFVVAAPSCVIFRFQFQRTLYARTRSSNHLTCSSLVVCASVEKKGDGVL